MKIAVTVLVTCLGLAAWAGNGVERDGNDLIDFDGTATTPGMQSQLNNELAQICPGLQSLLPEGPMASVDSMQVEDANGHRTVTVGVTLMGSGTDGGTVETPSQRRPRSIRLAVRQSGWFAWAQMDHYEMVPELMDKSCY